MKKYKSKILIAIIALLCFILGTIVMISVFPSSFLPTGEVRFVPKLLSCQDSAESYLGLRGLRPENIHFASQNDVNETRIEYYKTDVFTVSSSVVFTDEKQINKYRFYCTYREKFGGNAESTGFSVEQIVPFP